MDKTKRSIRRHHYYRLKRNRKHYNNFCFSIMHVNTPCLCSCPMCGNPRKHFGKRTIQELRSIESRY